MKEERIFVVCCCAENMDFLGRGEMVLASRTLFKEREANAYASTIASTRSPTVMTVTDYLISFCRWRTKE
jgi:hypothetical protein